MTDRTTSPIRSEPTRRGSDADVPEGDFSLDAFYASMKLSRRDRPHPVDLLVHPWVLDESMPAPEEVEVSVDVGGFPETVLIHLVVTNLRLITTHAGPIPGKEVDEYYRFPEYEAEGWLLAPHGHAFDMIWVRCALHTNDTENVEECIVYRLEVGEEQGTDWTSGIR